MWQKRVFQLKMATGIEIFCPPVRLLNGRRATFLSNLNVFLHLCPFKYRPNKNVAVRPFNHRTDEHEFFANSVRPAVSIAIFNSNSDAQLTCKLRRLYNKNNTENTIR